MTPRRYLEITFGSSAFRFRIGEPDCYDRDAFPELGQFAGLTLPGREPADFGRAGRVFADAYMKQALLISPSADDSFLHDLAEAMPGDMRHAFLCRIAAYLAVAVTTPEGWSEVARQLVALTNDRLQESLIGALCWECDAAGNFVGDDQGILRGMLDAG